MGNIAILADIHCGMIQHDNDVMWALRNISEFGLNNDIDTFVVLGDLFHNRESVNINSYYNIYNFLKNAKKIGQRWILIPGNHDMYLKYSWKVTSLSPLSEISTVIDKITTITLDSQRFWAVPFIYSEDAYLTIMDAIAEKYDENDSLFTHIGVYDSILNSCFLLSKWNMVTFNDYKFKHVFTGHYHIPQVVNDNVIYPGSIIPFRHSEGNVPHGFIIYNTDANGYHAIDINKIGGDDMTKKPPRYTTIHPDDINESLDVVGSIVRIACSHDTSLSDRMIYRDSLKDLGAKKVTFTTVSDDEKSDEDALKKAKRRNLEKLDFYGLFNAWCQSDTKGVDGLDSGSLVRMNTTIVNQGDEIYQNRKKSEL